MSDKIHETRVASIRVRRGLRKDLPNPLSPGEFGLCTDTNEVFIGSDTSSILGGMAARTVQLNQEVNGLALATSALNEQIVEFAVKRNIITGDGSTAFFPLLPLEQGITGLYPTVTRYREIGGGSILSMVPADDQIFPPVILVSETGTGTPIAHYRIKDNRIYFSDYDIPVNSDTIYVVHYKRLDIENLIKDFNLLENIAASTYYAYREVSDVKTGGSNYSKGQQLDITGGARITVTEVGAGGTVLQAILSEGGQYNSSPDLDIDSHVPSGTSNGATFAMHSKKIEFLVGPDQLYFDSSTGRGFFGLSTEQTNETVVLARSGSTTIKAALARFINSANPLNELTVSGSGIHTMSSEILGYMHDVTLSAAGTGYAVGDILTIEGGNYTTSITDQATVEVTSVNSMSTGAITGIKILSIGSYNINPPNAPTSVGSTLISIPWHVQSASVSAAGTDFSVNDVLTLSGGTFEIVNVDPLLSGQNYELGDTISFTSGTFSDSPEMVVQSINAAGGATKIAILSGGSCSVPPDASSGTSTSGNGTGCTLFTTTSQAQMQVVATGASNSIAQVTVSRAGAYIIQPPSPSPVTVLGTGQNATLNFTTHQPNNAATFLLSFSSDTQGDNLQDYRDSVLEYNYSGRFTADDRLGFTVHSPGYAKSILTYLNDDYVSGDGLDITQLSHIRSNIRMLTDYTFEEQSPDTIIANPMSLVLDASTPTEKFTGAMWPVTTSGTVLLDYTLTMFDPNSYPDGYDITRTGRIQLAFPLGGPGTINSTGKAVIIDQFTEVDLVGDKTTLFDTGDFGVSSNKPYVKFGAKVARYVAAIGHPTEPVGTPLADSEIGGLDMTAYAFAHPSNQYYGFLTYSNTFSAIASVRYTTVRFGHEQSPTPAPLIQPQV